MRTDGNHSITDDDAVEKDDGDDDVNDVTPQATRGKKRRR